MSTPILNGILIPKHVWNGRTYPKEVFDKAIEEYVQKMFMEERIKKLKIINEKIENNRKTRNTS